MAVKGLQRRDARDLAPRLRDFLADGQDAASSFGFTLMDDRISTDRPPSVRFAVRELLDA